MELLKWVHGVGCWIISTLTFDNIIHYNKQRFLITLLHYILSFPTTLTCFYVFFKPEKPNYNKINIIIKFIWVLRSALTEKRKQLLNRFLHRSYTLKGINYGSQVHHRSYKQYRWDSIVLLTQRILYALKFT